MEWGDDIYKAIKEAGVGQVAYVPDAGHKRLINACIDDNDIKAARCALETCRDFFDALEQLAALRRIPAFETMQSLL